MPYISKKITYEVFKNIPIPKVEEKEPEFYYFNKSSVRAKFNQLEFTNFVKIQRKGEEKIRFTINNASEKAYQFDKKYYIVFYNNDLVVYRALVHSYEAIGSSSTLTIELPISKKAYSDANRFKIEEIVEEKYTPVKLVEEDGDYQVMTCNYNADEIKYYFIDGKLSKIKETYKEESKNNPNYQENLLKYKVLSQEYKKIPNFQSTFVEYATSFTMINNFSHKDIEDKTLSDLKTYKFFKYNETKEVVSFEIEAQGYNCS